MAGLLQDQKSLVTGAGSGIGRACALGFAAEGATVCVSDIDLAAAERTVDAIVGQGGKAFAVRTDVTNPEELDALIAQCIATMGSLDSAVNNAGIIQPYNMVGDIIDADWDRQMSINLTSVFHCMRRELAVMRAKGSGSIVNMASGAGLKGNPGAGGYSAAKHGVIGLTKTAALEHGREGVRVNAICPGYIETPIHDSRKAEGKARDVGVLCPIGRAGFAHEIADAAVWLASNRSSYVTGIALSVDGGFSAM